MKGFTTVPQYHSACHFLYSKEPVVEGVSRAGCLSEPLGPAVEKGLGDGCRVVPEGLTAACIATQGMA